MLIIILIISTLSMTAWLVLLLRAMPADRENATAARLVDYVTSIRKQSAKEKAYTEKAAAYSGLMQKAAYLFLVKPSHNKAAALNKDFLTLKDGHQSFYDSFIMPGYVLQREIEAIGKSGFRKIILSKTFELYGKKYAQTKANQILAKILSYPVFGISAVLLAGVILLSFTDATIGMGIVGVGIILILVLVYGIYDELCDMVNKREQAISRQFPNVISKLALLVTSGMIMDRAWKETAYSQDTELYIEMRRTSKELDNLVSPEVAFGNFITRCNVKETARLASAILQNQSKGNAEIGKLLKDIAREVWQERRHTAKRDAEKANSKLMIPTMMLFLAILVMLMVPIAMNFSGI